VPYAPLLPLIVISRSVRVRSPFPGSVGRDPMTWCRSMMRSAISSWCPTNRAPAPVAFQQVKFLRVQPVAIG
jgi:hypothetical protein